MDPKTGRCAVLFPHGVLFRREEAELRQKLVEADVVECVLGLGPNLFYNSAMEACVVFCRSRKPPKKRGKVLFIDAANEVAHERKMSSLRAEHQQRIEAAYDAFAEEEGFAKIATIKEIAAQSYSLAIPLYVERAPAATSVTEASRARTLRDEWEAWGQSGGAFWREIDGVVDVLDALVCDEESANG
jgi:type I restriction enzyme M protein